MSEIKGDWYAMDVYPDITAYELALILQSMEIKLSPEVYNSLPKELHRHFREEKYVEDIDC